MQFNRAKASSSTRGQPRLHFPKLSGKLSCLPTKRKINLFNVCSCRQLLNSIKHSLKRLTQTTLLPTPVEHKHALCEKRMSTENFLTICKTCKYFSTTNINQSKYPITMCLYFVDKCPRLFQRYMIYQFYC